MSDPTSDGRPSLAWRILLLAALAAGVLQLVTTAISVTASTGQLRIAAALAAGGFMVLRALVAYGVWERARWSLGTGGVIAALTVLGTLVLLLSQVRVESGANAVELSSPVSIALAWAQVAANLAFLAGLVLLRTGR